MGKLYMNEELFGSDDSRDIKYDNSASQIEADNVQDAIDEIQSKFNGIEVILDYILTGVVGDESNIYKVFNAFGISDIGGEFTID